ncbi:MAG: pilus assembly protein [Actinobacteria bacterium]|nr:pilus assembly protein [Actinomycetota bacterium]
MKKNKHSIKYCKEILMKKILFLRRINLAKKPGSRICQCGQASMEFALVVPFLFFIILVVIQAGYLVYLQNLVEHATHESARIVATTGSDSEARNCVFQILNNKSGGRIETNITPESGSRRRTGSIVRVEVNYYYDGVAKVIKLLTGKSMLINSISIMRMECSDE